MNKEFLRHVFPILVFFFSVVLLASGQNTTPYLTRNDPGTRKPVSVRTSRPLDELSLVNAGGRTVQVKDGTGRVYVSTPSSPHVIFRVSGSLGKHVICVKDKHDKTIFETSFQVDAPTSIDDGSRYRDMFELFYKGMEPDKAGSVVWNGKTYRYFVPWGLDHCHTMKGLKYFLPFGEEFVDLMRQTQRDDGMIWSFVEHQSNLDYYRTRDSLTGYTKKIGDRYFVRQPTENHPEYIYVKTIYQCWKASGDDEWMKKNLSSAEQALNYAINDPARWSKRFQLLKRVYTIDSWDFQVDDEYTPDIGMTNSMIIDPQKSKFGVFFGDNTGYIMACEQLAEMYAHAGMKTESARFAQRAVEFADRLNALAWNGKFYTHFIDEDPTVRRKLGVDEKSQLAQSNAYSLNRGLPHDKSKAIIESYLRLKNNLPVGSPGEWYAIYPPFEKGFDIHGKKWQYMNGGVGGHVAGELARGAYEHGYENYGTDILERLFELGKKYDHKIYFAYTGSLSPPPPAADFKTVNLRSYANMDTWDKGSAEVFSWMNSKRPGDDLRKLPVGRQKFANILFDVIHPEANGRKAVVAVSRRNGFKEKVEITIQDSAKSVYFLHTSTKPTSENVCGAVSFAYEDGTQVTRYIIMGKHLTYWWFSELKTEYSGIAWYGSNAVSRGVGLSWCAIDNPHPEKLISKIILHAPQDEGIYSVLGITLSNQSHYVPVNPVSFGGPDNWAAATAMAALVEGLAGVKDAPGAQAFSEVSVSPRWSTSKADSVSVTIRYPASDGYVAYIYTHRSEAKQIAVTITGSGEKANCHVLLPKKPLSISIDGRPAEFKISEIESSFYADFVVDLHATKTIIIRYN
jgi:hypothetical protein